MSQLEYAKFSLFALLDPTWHFPNQRYQELTAVVTEVSAPNLEGPTDISGEGHTLGDPKPWASLSQRHNLVDVL